MKIKWIIMAGLVGLCGLAQAAFITIDDAGNTADTTGYGAVGYVYQISATEVTIAQMQAATGAGDGDEDYWSSVGTDAAASNVSLYEAMKYCNRITTGDANSGYYSTSDGGATYQANALSHNEYAEANGLSYFVATEDEWYKAAYYTGDSEDLWSFYANGTDTAPVAGTNANYSGSSVWAVESGTVEQNGTYDMGGNVWEWTEASDGVFRGGSYVDEEDILRSTTRHPSSYYKDLNSSSELDNIGFRVVAIPEPAAMLLLVLGGLIIGGYRRLLK